MQKPKLLIVLGPTSAGKSDLAVMLAKEFNGEIISADSRQVYKGLDIGSGKITKTEMRNVPHYLLSVTSPKKQFSVALFKKKAERAIVDILRRNKLPIICGGTGFYIQALVGNVTLPEVPVNKNLRKDLAKKETSELFNILKKIDSTRAENIDCHNPRRIIRAIEIARYLGYVPAIDKNTPTKYDTLFIGLDIPSDKLKERIKTRLQKRMRTGMLSEAVCLHKQGLSYKRMEELGLEYRHLAIFLKGGTTKKEMIEQLNTKIWHYAKRQRTWFKRNKQTHWFNPLKKTDIKKVRLLVKKFISSEQ